MRYNVQTNESKWQKIWAEKQSFKATEDTAAVAVASDAQASGAEQSRPKDSTGILVLSDGSVFWGYGLGAAGDAVGEVCFNTSMTGYQEILTDPSYAGQIITFTFPHIGNVGANREDIETTTPAVRNA